MSKGNFTGIDWGRDDRTIICWWRDGVLIDKAAIPNLRLLNDQILVALDPDEVEKTSAGGILIPQTSTDDIMRRGTVVKTGPGEWAHKPEKRDLTVPDNWRGIVKEAQAVTYHRKPLGVEVGERVLFIKFAVSHTETAKRVQALIGKSFGLVRPTDILLVGPDVDKVTG
jgi:co-chaperonin GroES (HSP10)